LGTRAANSADTAELTAWLRLVLAPEIGPVLAHRLLQAVGPPHAIFSSKIAVLQAVPGLGPGRLAKLLDAAAERAAREEMERVQTAGVHLITLHDPDYPPLLRRLTHAPLLLWVQGRLAPEDRLALAIVGPRQPSQYARLMAEALCPPLASQGLTLVSGLAYGVDAAAHRAAVETGGRTLAVLGQGLGTPIYPQPNAELARRIVAEDRGALISIFPLRTEPAAGLFPLRNEIIAGLALATLVIEAAPESGSLITARHAAAAQRLVLACPGDATRRSAQGSNRLLADGAMLVQTPEDVMGAMAQELRREMQELAPQAQNNAAGLDAPEAVATSTAPPRARAATDPVERSILEHLAAEPLTGDIIMERCAEQGLTLPQVLEALLTLELAGTVRQLPGRLYARA
jgi:DNA processing protein